MPRIPSLDSPAWLGGEVTSYAQCILAPNPSPMTLDGTNTWLLHDSEHVAVIDPGPVDPGHQDRILAAIELGGWTPSAILVTHRHLDHAQGAPALAARLRIPLHFPEEATGSDEPLAVHEVGSLVIRVIRTPGHTSDSVCMVLEELHGIVTGDTVLGRGTSVIAPPDGDLGAYLASLQMLRECADGLTMLLPGHGPPQDDPVDVLEGYLLHRRARLDEVRAALASGAANLDEVRAIVYPEISPDLEHAASWSVRAQLAFLRSHGELPTGWTDALLGD